MTREKMTVPLAQARKAGPELTMITTIPWHRVLAASTVLASLGCCGLLQPVA
jgi:hypothetical protein